MPLNTLSPLEALGLARKYINSLSSKELPTPARRVLSALAERADCTEGVQSTWREERWDDDGTLHVVMHKCTPGVYFGEAWPKIPTLANELKVSSTRYVERALEVLQRRGFVTKRVAPAGTYLPRMTLRERHNRPVFKLEIPPWRKVNPDHCDRDPATVIGSRSQRSDRDPINSGSASSSVIEQGNLSSPPPTSPSEPQASRRHALRGGGGSLREPVAPAGATPKSRASGAKASVAPARGAVTPNAARTTSSRASSAGREPEPNGESHKGARAPRPAPRRRDALEVLAHWRRTFRPADVDAPPPAAGLELLERRLAEGRTPDELRAVVDGAASSKKNRKPARQTLRALFGSDAAVETLAELGRLGGARRRSQGGPTRGVTEPRSPVQNGSQAGFTNREQMITVPADEVARFARGLDDPSPPPTRPRHDRRDDRTPKGGAHGDA